MQVKIVGGHGGVAPGFKSTSYLIDGKILIDAGSCATGLLIDEQVLIDHILISHSHLDHIKDLAFIADNCFGLKGKPFEVWTNETVTSIIKKHLFNETIWPDFSKLPNEEDPTVRFNNIEVEKVLKLGKYEITPVLVNHPNEAMGFIVRDGKSTVVFTQDSGPTERIWELAKKEAKLKAIFTEVSFPNSLKGVAEASQHHTPNSMREEIKKMPGDVPIYLGHLKPNYQTKLFQEIDEIGDERVSLLGTDDSIYHF